MICQKCKLDFLESGIEVSHDVPVYMFEGINRNERRNQADKFGRHNLCKKCHDIYEKKVFAVCFNSLSKEDKENKKILISSFAKSYFKEDDNGKGI